jgi:hypothetical protein
MLLSPVISEIIAGPNPVRIYEFRELRAHHGFFQLFIQILQGQEVDVDWDNQFFLGAVARELQIERMKPLSDCLDNCPISPQNAVAVLRNFSEHGIDKTFALDFVVENWELVKSDEKLVELSLTDLKMIFGRIPAECKRGYEFFDLVCGIVSRRGHEFATLFVFCPTARLEKTQMEQMLPLIAYDEIPCDVLLALQDRLICETIAAHARPRRTPRRFERLIATMPMTQEQEQTDRELTHFDRFSLFSFLLFIFSCL